MLNLLIHKMSKTEKNGQHKFPTPMMMSSNILLCPTNSPKCKTIEYEQMAFLNLWHFWLKNYLMFDYQNKWFLSASQNQELSTSRWPAHLKHVKIADLWHCLCWLTVRKHCLLPLGEIQLFLWASQWQLDTGRLQDFPTGSHDSVPAVTDRCFFHF